jgi:hypothetical protein
LQLCWLLWCAGLSAALLWGTDLAWWQRGLLLGVATVSAARGLAALRRPGRELRRLSWGADGRWQLQNRVGELSYVVLACPPQSFGPLLWLRLRDANHRETVLVDTATVEPQVLALLKARLRLDRPA